MAVVGVDASGAFVAPPRSRLEVAYAEVAGVEQRGRLDVLWNVPFERMSPVRSFGSFKGQRSFQGSWWLATTGEHVGFESWLERDVLMLLDFDPDVVGVSSQPFWLIWRGEDDSRRRHAPDYFARPSDGSGVVIDVRADDRIRGADAEAFAVTRRACDEVGWSFRRCGAADNVVAANVRWLAGYRHPRCLNRLVADRLVAWLVTPMPLVGLVGAIGDRVAVLPTLFHLMWTGAVRADLTAGLRSGATVLEAGPRAS